ncbi:MAG: hypothetical protein ACKO41_06765 [Sphingomonadales bacterium]
MKKCVFVHIGSIIFLLALPFSTMAQVDTTTTSGVTIVSSFRPMLKQAAKINFSAPALLPDTTRSVWPYKISQRPLVLDYSLRSVQPIAYTTDTARPFGNRAFVKAGYGNLRNPYLRVGIDRGDGVHKGLSISGRFLSLKQFPDTRSMRFYQLGEFGATGYTQLKKLPLRLSSTVGFKRELIYHNLFYDSTRAVSSFPLDSVRQQFSWIHARVQLNTTAPFASGISVAPLVTFYRFFDNRSNSESQLQLQAPLQKQIGDHWQLQTLFTLQALFYNHQRAPQMSIGVTDTLIRNTLWGITPSVRYQQSSFQVQAAISPTWNEGRFATLPRLALSYLLPGKKTTLMAGWVSSWNQNSYRELVAINPWSWAPGALRTSRQVDRYLGVKGQVNPRFSYDLRVRFVVTNDQPLFVNDTAIRPSSAYKVVYEEELRQLQLDASITYKVADQFSLSSRLLLNHFLKPIRQPAVWGLLPLEWQNSLRVSLTDELWLHADWVLFRGAQSIDTYKGTTKINWAVDMNAGLTYRLSKSLQLWAQFNNLFNQPYQRWNRNPVFGFNCSGGIVFSFPEKKKS